MDNRMTIYALTALAALALACGQAPGRANNAGHAPYLSGEYAESLRAYEQAQELKEGAPEPVYNAANARQRMGALDEALEDYREALLNADDALREDGFFNAGNAHFNLEQYQQAIEAYRETLRLNPDNEDAKQNLELALAQLLQEQPDQPPQQQPGGEESEEDAQDGQGPQPQEEPPQDSGDESEDEQQPSEGDEEQENEAPQPVPQQQTEPLTEEQARQLLEVASEGSQTLQERLQQRLYVPSPATQDW